MSHHLRVGATGSIQFLIGPAHGDQYNTLILNYTDEHSSPARMSMKSLPQLDMEPGFVLE